MKRLGIVAAIATLSLSLSAHADAPPPHLAVARKLHTATMMGDGKVLLVGGMLDGNTFGTVAAAELFDPASGTWSSAGNLAQGRNRHTTTVLDDGRVLVAGGQMFDPMISNWSKTSDEMWDPATNTFSLTGSLATPRSDHTAVKLSDGRVLVAGGFSANGDAPEAEVFDPVSESWSNAGSLGRPRIIHAMVALASGDAAVIGGVSNDYVTTIENGVTLISQTLDELDSIEVWDHDTQTWSVVAHMTTPRAGHALIALGKDRVLIVGGDDVKAFKSTAEICDLKKKKCKATGSLKIPRSGHVLVKLANGDIAAVGGETGTIDKPHQVALVEVWNPKTGKWRSTATLITARHEHTATLLGSGVVLVAGGSGCGIGCENTLDGTELLLP